MSTDPTGFAFISLLRDELEARGLAGLLESVARTATTVESVFLVPEVRGLDFFAASARQREVDLWWARNVPPSLVPVYLLCHEEGLAAWLPGLDGVAMVASGDHSAGSYTVWTVVPAEPCEAPLALAEAVIVRFGAPDQSLQPSVADIFDRRDARMVAELRTDTNLPGRSSPDFAPLLHVDGARVDTIQSDTGAMRDPTDLQEAKGARDEKGSLAADDGHAEAKQVFGGRPRLRERLPILGKRPRRIGARRR